MELYHFDRTPWLEPREKANSALPFSREPACRLSSTPEGPQMGWCIPPPTVYVEGCYCIDAILQLDVISIT